MINGVDIASPYQDWWKPAAGQDFAIVKASQNTGYRNPQRYAKLKLARKAGLVTGHYHWMGKGGLQAQLANFVAAADVRPGDLVCVDWEESGVSVSDKDWFIRQLKKRYPNNKVGLYCNVNYWNNVDTSDYYGDFLWIAYYSSKQPPINDPWTIWQYSDSTGIDLNRAKFGSRAEMKKWAQGKPSSAPSRETVAGVPLPSYRKSGTNFRWRGLYHGNNGAPNTCFCVTKAIAVAEARLIKMGEIKECLDFWQFGYANAVAASAGTHNAGGVVDVVQTSDKVVRVLREVGFAAAWYRGPGYKFGNMSTRHIHAVLAGCPHVSTGAADQLKSVKAGRNGLANGAADYGPRVKFITWQKAWNKYVKREAVKPTKPKEDLEVADHIGMTNTKRQVLPAPTKSGAAQYTWLKLKNNGSTSLIGSPGKVIGGMVELVVSGLREADCIWLYPGAYDVIQGKKCTARYTDANYPVRITGEKTGWVRTRVPFDWVLGDEAKGYDYRALRFRAAASRKNVVVESMRVTGWYVRG